LLRSILFLDLLLLLDQLALRYLLLWKSIVLRYFKFDLVVGYFAEESVHTVYELVYLCLGRSTNTLLAETGGGIDY
jgi:hypothetical protein